MPENSNVRHIEDDFPYAYLKDSDTAYCWRGRYVPATDAADRVNARPQPLD